MHRLTGRMQFAEVTAASASLTLRMPIAVSGVLKSEAFQDY